MFHSSKRICSVVDSCSHAVIKNKKKKPLVTNKFRLTLNRSDKLCEWRKKNTPSWIVWEKLSLSFCSLGRNLGSWKLIICPPNFIKDQPWRVSSFIEDDMCSVVRSLPRASWTPAACQDEMENRQFHIDILHASVADACTVLLAPLTKLHCRGLKTG